ncbi:unnamed protein product [marine sediment metagenome]|uniref:Uncharacterized protein n=1 Tax=marine sediment metagenome TaxID=412755 RepID=X1RVM1_9ZZZZ
MKKKQLIPILIELIGISIISVGIGLEITLGGDVFFVLITLGSLLIATGSIIWGKFMRSK